MSHCCLSVCLLVAVFICTCFFYCICHIAACQCVCSWLYNVHVFSIIDDTLLPVSVFARVCIYMYMFFSIIDVTLLPVNVFCTWLYLYVHGFFIS